ncbi:MAG: molybdopterin converting factor subunit 1 [Acidobacteriota bacterium]|nr:molybdopterin converting factor subunit 1 [Acidobacteriota bacterium]
MRVRVLYFAALRDHAGCEREDVELAEGGTVAALLEQVRPRAAGFSWSSIAVAVNEQYAQPQTELHEGDEVALLPPVSGGSSPQPRLHVALVREPIDAAAIVAEMKAGADGAVCLFDGIVRDNTRGRPTLHLDYEAYETMALQQMQQLAAEAVARFGVREVSLVHRLGRLLVGETSVLIVVASAHRAAAFDACRWLIDTLKKSVPVWKKEQFADGAVWADGEPFPEAIALQPGPDGAQAE